VNGHVCIFQRLLDILLEVVAEIVCFADIGIFPHDNVEVDKALRTGLAGTQLVVPHYLAGVFFNA
jgi:hypothetical protein